MGAIVWMPHLYHANGRSMSGACTLCGYPLGNWMHTPSRDPDMAARYPSVLIREGGSR